MTFGAPSRYTYPWHDSLNHHIGQFIDSNNGGINIWTTSPTTGVDGQTLGVKHTGYTGYNSTKKTIERWDGSNWIELWFEEYKETFSGHLVVYVSNKGDDNNDGKSLTTAFETLQKAVDYVCSLKSINPWTDNITILVDDGVYAGVQLKEHSLAYPRHCSISCISKNRNNCTIRDGLPSRIQDQFTIAGSGYMTRFTFSDFTIEAIDYAYCVGGDHSSAIGFSKCRFYQDDAPRSSFYPMLIHAVRSSTINCNDCTFAGVCWRCINAGHSSIIGLVGTSHFDSIVCGFPNDPNTSGGNSVLQAHNGGYIGVTSPGSGISAFSGTAQGPSVRIHFNSTIYFTYGELTANMPGNKSIETFAGGYVYSLS